MIRTKYKLYIYIYIYIYCIYPVHATLKPINDCRSVYLHTKSIFILLGIINFFV